ncbi:N-acetylmuramoyl-L-alanine amidase [Limosilactobacillus caecicola]|uniref:N-acetylmuramoyl-L-alanine amidase n=1 Tax=Limosilactobacillus caecicola TaxID=2941332 RepID=UPI00203B60BA|nr:N-acetylmuramoyl-L-alanine amidase [Limosilactobacillus caecicola]
MAEIKKQPLNKSQLVACGFIIVSILLIIALIYRGTVMVNPETMPVKSGPGISYSTVKVSKTHRVLITGERHSWYRVRLNDHQSAWVPSWLIHSHTPLKKSNYLAGATIAIDPGHGGSDSGAAYFTDSSKSRYQEKTYTLAIAKRLARQLEKAGARVVMTRSKDRAVGLKERVKIAENQQVDCFISLHLNSSPNRNEASGVTTYYYHQNRSKVLARAVSRHFSNLPLSNRGIDFGDFLVIRDTSIPSILCETGYVNSKKDFRQIRRPSFQRRVAQDIRAGINDYLKQIQ